MEFISPITTDVMWRSGALVVTIPQLRFSCIFKEVFMSGCKTQIAHPQHSYNHKFAYANMMAPISCAFDRVEVTQMNNAPKTEQQILIFAHF
ncbi:hypothetical protein GCM10023188_19280 [Pontibacter saemangeumensis]|uniref:Uncharacterized protein n=1 Tax=Pontibacter saemangeumensis TaxID=1084525 RepID=A0ABP8LMI0_9BACT